MWTLIINESTHDIVDAQEEYAEVSGLGAGLVLVHFDGTYSGEANADSVPGLTVVDYMQKMRDERDARLNAIEWRVQRNYSQVQKGDTPTDDATKMTEIYTYQQDLRDMPQDNPSVTTKAQWDALTWPSEPA